MNSFAQLLAQLLTQKGMTKQDLADKSGRSFSYVNLLLGGHRTSPSKQVIEDFANALELTEYEKETLMESVKKQSSTSKKPIPLSGTEITTPLKDDVTDEADNGGVVCAYKTLNTEKLNGWIAESKEFVRIMDTWMINPTNLRNVFLEAWQNNLDNPDFIIQILLLDPKSEIAKLRSIDIWLNEEEIDTDFVSNMVRMNLWQIRKMQEKNPSIHVRLYQTLPSFSLYATEEYGFVGFYAHGSQSDVVPNIEVKMRKDKEYTTIAEFLINREFDILWNAAEKDEDLKTYGPPYSI